MGTLSEVTREGRWVSKKKGDSKIFVAQQPIEGQGLPTDCWPNFHLLVDRIRSFSLFRDLIWSARRAPSHCWHSRPGLPLQIKFLTTLGYHRPYTLTENFPSPGIEAALHHIAL